MVYVDSGTYIQHHDWLCADLTQACDACRTMNWQCVRADAENMFAGDCRSCVETGSLCDTSLACLNISRPHHMSQDYQMQLMLLHQQNKKRLLMARQEQDNVGQSWSQPSHHVATPTVNYPSGNHTLQDYQMQVSISGPGESALDNQAQLPVQKSTERPLEARND